MLPYASIPAFWRWLYYASMYRYPLGFLVSSEMRGKAFTCPRRCTDQGAGIGKVCMDEMAVPVFVGGANATVPPPPYGLGPYKPPCNPVHCLGRGGLDNCPFADLDDARCWRQYCPIQEGNDILSMYNFPLEAGPMWAQLGVLVVFFVVIRLLTYVGMKHVQHIKR